MQRSDLVIRELLPLYYQKVGLPAHGGQNGWIDYITLYGITCPMPNPPARKKVLPIHDAHHLVTGYGVDWRGEGEVSAWGMGAGGPVSLLTLAYDGGGMLIGLCGSPRRTIEAFYRGLGCTKLYDWELEDVLSSDLATLREATGIDQVRERTTADRWALLRTFVLVFFIGVFTPVLVAVGSVLGVPAKRRSGHGSEDGTTGMSSPP